MTDVRRTGPPQRLTDRMRIGIPIEGEVDGIWQHAMQAEILEEVDRHPDLPGSEFFGKSLSITPDQIKLYFNVSSEWLPRYLDMIETAIPRANQIAQTQRARLHAAGDEAQRELLDRDEEIKQEMTAWAEKHPAIGPARADSALRS